MTISPKEQGRIFRAAMAMARMQRPAPDPHDQGWNSGIIHGIALGLSIGLDSDGSYDVVDEVTDYFNHHHAELASQVSLVDAHSCWLMDCEGIVYPVELSVLDVDQGKR